MTETEELKYRLRYIEEMMIEYFWELKGEDGYYVKDEYTEDKSIIQEITLVAAMADIVYD